MYQQVLCPIWPYWLKPAITCSTDASWARASALLAFCTVSKLTHKKRYKPAATATVTAKLFNVMTILSANARPSKSQHPAEPHCPSLNLLPRTCGPDNMLMQLASLELTNFQAHKRLEVRFAPGITTIIGPTDKGKTSILRALGWVAQNNLGGEEFIREGAKETCIKLVVTDGKKSFTIVRCKGKSNSYSLDGKEYLAFGQNVPTDIAKLLQLNEINFQGQHDAPFWFSETAGEVSRRLNAVIDLTIIDSTLSNIASAVRQGQERKSLYEERLKEVRYQLEELRPQRVRVEEFAALKEKKKADNEATRNHLQLADLVTSYSEYSNRVRDYQTKSLVLQTVFNNAKEAVRLARQENLLQDLIKDIEESQAAAKPPPNFTPVQNAYALWEKLRGQRDDLSRLVELIADRQNSVSSWAAVVWKKADEFTRKTKNQKCPLCQQTIT